MMEILFYLVVVALLAAGVVVGALFLRGYLNGTSPGAGIFGPKPERRIDIVEQSNLDGRRRLVLIRRDNIEHLIMTGGPVDVVIETGITSRRLAAGEVVEPPATVFTRQPRTLGQTAAEQ